MFGLYPARGRKLQLLIQFGSAMAFTLFGWDAGVISGVISTPAFIKTVKYDGNDKLLTFCVAGILLGDVFGCILVSNFAYRIGRRLCIIWACYVGIIGAILQASTFSTTQMIVGRIVLGFGNGAISALIPAFVQESSVRQEKVRTADTMVTIAYGVAGIAAANWVDYGMYKTNNPTAWRAPIAVQAFFLIAGLVVFHGVMESPRWLYAKNRMAEGDDSLSRLMDVPVDNEQLQAKKQEILAALKLEELEATESLLSVNLLFKDKSETRVAKRIWLSWAVLLGSPLYGGNVIVFYGSSIFAALHLDTETIQICTATLQTAAPVGMIFAFYLLPRFGRLPLLLYGGTGQVTCMVLFTILANLGSRATSTTQWVAISFLYVFQFINGLTWLWLPFLYCVEIVPTRYRGQAISIGNATFWAIAFVEVYAAPIALDRATGPRIFVWFCITGAFVLSMVFWLGKETKGLSLEQIDLLWASDEYKQNNTEAMAIEGFGAKTQMLENEKDAGQA